MLSHGGIFLLGGGLEIPCQLYMENHAQPWRDFPSRWRTRNSLSVVHREPCSAMEGFFLPGGGLEIPCQLYIENHAQPWRDFSFQVED